MIFIQDTIISSDLTDEYFCCNLSGCKGICCVEGESGAPIEESEIVHLEKVLPIVWNSLSVKARRVIERQGIVYLDTDGEYVISIVDGKDCIFTCYDEHDVCRCAIEKAYREGKTDFRKPISCHLYPVRVRQYKEYRAVNYHHWEVCDIAREQGKQRGIKVYQFLKEPLIRKFGEEWYNELVASDV
ncbi:MAG: DUF3109 family protein [Dysgonamonadaceae bacterium]|nr:DUF3109 family protein [Dysgonamonadaceae bacterium]